MAWTPPWFVLFLPVRLSRLWLGLSALQDRGRPRPFALAPDNFLFIPRTSNPRPTAGSGTTRHSHTIISHATRRSPTRHVFPHPLAHTRARFDAPSWTHVHYTHTCMATAVKLSIHTSIHNTRPGVLTTSKTPMPRENDRYGRSTHHGLARGIAPYTSHLGRPPLSRPHILVGWVVRDGGIGAMVRASSLPCITSIAHNRAHSLPVEHQPYAQYGLARAVISDAAR